MASSIHPHATASPSYRRNRFFAWTAVAMLIVIALGFGKSFYVRPWFNAKPLPMYLIVHGVTMTAWYLMFLAQASLVAAGRSNLHRKLGIAGVVLAVGVVVTGILVHINRVPRMQALGHVTSAEDLSRAIGFALAGVSSLVPFAILVALAVLLRRKTAVHKRLMFWALVWTLGPAFTNTRPLGAVLDTLVTPYLPFFPADLFWFAALCAYDWATQRRIHPATYLGFLSLAFYFFHHGLDRRCRLASGMGSPERGRVGHPPSYRPECVLRLMPATPPRGSDRRPRFKVESQEPPLRIGKEHSGTRIYSNPHLFE